MSVSYKGEELVAVYLVNAKGFSYESIQKIYLFYFIFITQPCQLRPYGPKLMV